MSFSSRLKELLKTDSRFTDDFGDLIISAVRDRAWRIDHDLIRLLLSDEEVKSKFFDQIDGYWVFNTNTFVDYISQVNFLDNSYTRFRNKIGLTIGDDFISERGDVALAFPYKDCILEGGQTKEEEKRKEIFFNEVLSQDEINQLLAPKVLTNFKRYAVGGEQSVTDFKRDENGIIRENLIIKGNNLLALHSLIEQFRGQVKLICIDPPYNTGNDSFGYNDNFNHSTWLTFMKNRLEIAKLLLRDDGSIWIIIDDNEAHYLKILLDGIFGRENFISNVVWQHSVQGKNDSSTISLHHNYVLVYRRTNKFHPKLLKRLEKHNRAYSNPDNDPRGEWRSGDVRSPNFRENLVYDIVTPSGKKIAAPKKGWRWSKDLINEKIRSGEIIFSEDETKIIRKIYLAEQSGRIAESIWFGNEVGTTRDANREIKHLYGETVFSTPKPEKLLQRIIHIGSEKNDLIMDFFSGSGTTAAVAHKMQRKYVAIEQMDSSMIYLIKRLQKVISGEQGGITKLTNWVGGSDFIYCEFKQFNDAFIDKIQKVETTEQILQIWQDMAKSSFLKWYVNPEVPEDALNNFFTIGQEENGLEKQKRLLIELLDKNQLYVNLSEIDDAQFDVSEEDKALNRAFYKEG